MSIANETGNSTSGPVEATNCGSDGAVSIQVSRKKDQQSSIHSREGFHLLGRGEEA